MKNDSFSLLQMLFFTGINFIFLLEYQNILLKWNFFSRFFVNF